MSSVNGRPDILTVTGNYFDYLNPENNVFSIYDIAHHLSMLCRFCGAVRLPYSVAEHSVMVSRLCSPMYAMEGLLHDMAEMAMQDLPGPLKQLVPDYKKIEKRVEAAMAAKMGVPYPFHPNVKLADRFALYVEQRDLMPIHEDHWAAFEGLELETIQAYPRIEPRTWEQARDDFINEYVKLGGVLP